MSQSQAVSTCLWQFCLASKVVAMTARYLHYRNMPFQTLLHYLPNDNMNDWEKHYSCQWNFLGLAPTTGGWKISKPMSWEPSLFLSFWSLASFSVPDDKNRDGSRNIDWLDIQSPDTSFTLNESFIWYVIHVKAKIATCEWCGVTIRLHLPGAYILLHTGFGIAGCFTALWQPTVNHGTLTLRLPD